MIARFNQLLLIALMGSCLLFGQSGAHAQDAATGWEVVVPDASLCQAQPRTVDQLIALFANATPAAATSASDHVEVPTGQTASATLVDEITATTYEAFACLNAGEWLRFMGLLTDNAILTAFPWLVDELVMGVVPDELATPSPLPADLAQTVIAIADVRTVGNDRAGAIVVFLDPASGNPGASALYLVFTRAGTDWLIDEVIAFGDE